MFHKPIFAEAQDDWLLRNRKAINEDIDETFAQAARGAGYSLEETRTLLAERRALRVAASVFNR